MNIIMRDDTEHGIEYVKADEVRDYLNKAIAAEREACAQVCERMAKRSNDIRTAALEMAAENIRARGEK